MNHFLTWLAAGMAVAGLAFGLAFLFTKRGRARREAQRETLALAARAQAERDQAERIAALQAARDSAASAEAERVRRADAAQAAQAAREQQARDRLARDQAAQAERRAAEAARAAEIEREQAERARQREQTQRELERQQAERTRELAAAERARAAEAAQEHAARRAAQEESDSRAAHEAALRRATQATQARERAAQAAAEQAARADPPATPPATTRTPGQTLIMVADDSKVVRVKAGRLLTQHGFRVAYASDGLEAAREVRKILPDVVITDVEMPGMDGFELTRHVRVDAATAHIPVIMITAADAKHRGEAERAGVNALLGKPYADEALIEQIQLALGHTLRTAVPG